MSIVAVVALQTPGGCYSNSLRDNSAGCNWIFSEEFVFFFIIILNFSPKLIFTVGTRIKRVHGRLAPAR